jgi:hypothetical protein
LGPGTQSRFFQEIDGLNRLLDAMAPQTLVEDTLIHGLDAKLDSFHSKISQKSWCVLGDIIWPGREPDPVNLAAIDKRMNRRQEFSLVS